MLLICFKLSGPDEDYQGFFDTMFANRDHYRVSDTCYIVEGAVAIGMRNNLIKHLLPKDRLIVVSFFADDAAGQMGPVGKEWLKNRLYKHRNI